MPTRAILYSLALVICLALLGTVAYYAATGSPNSINNSSADAEITTISSDGSTVDNNTLIKETVDLGKLVIVDPTSGYKYGRVYEGDLLDLSVSGAEKVGLRWDISLNNGLSWQVLKQAHNESTYRWTIGSKNGVNTHQFFSNAAVLRASKGLEDGSFARVHSDSFSIVPKILFSQAESAGLDAGQVFTVGQQVPIRLNLSLTSRNLLKNNNTLELATASNSENWELRPSVFDAANDVIYWTPTQDDFKAGFHFFRIRAQPNPTYDARITLVSEYFTIKELTIRVARPTTDGRHFQVIFGNEDAIYVIIKSDQALHDTARLGWRWGGTEASSNDSNWTVLGKGEDQDFALVTPYSTFTRETVFVWYKLPDTATSSFDKQGNKFQLTLGFMNAATGSTEAQSSWNPTEDREWANGLLEIEIAAAPSFRFVKDQKNTEVGVTYYQLIQPPLNKIGLVNIQTEIIKLENTTLEGWEWSIQFGDKNSLVAEKLDENKEHKDSDQTSYIIAVLQDTDNTQQTLVHYVLADDYFSDINAIDEEIPDTLAITITATNASANLEMTSTTVYTRKFQRHLDIPTGPLVYHSPDWSPTINRYWAAGGLPFTGVLTNSDKSSLDFDYVDIPPNNLGDSFYYYNFQYQNGSTSQKSVLLCKWEGPSNYLNNIHKPLKLLGGPPDNGGDSQGDGGDGNNWFVMYNDDPIAEGTPISVSGTIPGANTIPVNTGKQYLQRYEIDQKFAIGDTSKLKYDGADSNGDPLISIDNNAATQNAQYNVWFRDDNAFTNLWKPAVSFFFNTRRPGEQGGSHGPGICLLDIKKSLNATGTDKRTLS